MGPTRGQLPNQAVGAALGPPPRAAWRRETKPFAVLPCWAGVWGPVARLGLGVCGGRARVCVHLGMSVHGRGCGHRHRAASRCPAESWPRRPLGRTARSSSGDSHPGSLLGRAGQMGLWVDPCQVSWLALPPSGHPQNPGTWGWSGQRAGPPSPRVAKAIVPSGQGAPALWAPPGKWQVLRPYTLYQPR